MSGKCKVCTELSNTVFPDFPGVDTTDYRHYPGL